MNTPEIIVYRNPAEKMLWDSVMDGSIFPIFVGLFVFFTVFICCTSLIEKIGVRRNNNNKVVMGSIIISTLLGMIVTWLLWL